MGDIIYDYQAGLAGAMLHEGVVRLARPLESEGKLRIEYENQIMGEPGTPLYDMAVFGYASVLKESGLMTQDGRLPSILAFSGVRPLVTRVIREAYGNEWRNAIGALPIPDPSTTGNEEQPVILFDTTLDERSVHFAKIAERYGRVIGAIALLDLQRGSRTALKDIGVSHVHSVITLQAILRSAMRNDNVAITPRECIEILGELDPRETSA